MRLSSLFLLLSVLAIESMAATQVRIQPPQSDADASHPYYLALLQRVLDETTDEFGEARVEVVSTPYTQSRSFAALSLKQLDVTWSGANVQRQTRFRAVEIPLFAGLLGIRVPVIRADRLEYFTQHTRREDWQALIACQGSQWPDTDILMSNGFKVERVTKFELMYAMLKQGRCDYFPRGLNEVYSELAALNAPELMAFEETLLRYPFPMYFFVANDNEALWQRLNAGLERMVSSGGLVKFLETHPATAEIFPLSRLSSSQVLELTNPMLPPGTPSERAELWLTVGH